MNEVGWKPPHFVNNVSSSVGSVMKPAGFENGQDIISSYYLKDPTDPHAFFLCTDPRDFQALAESAYNVVLQRYVRAPDDGSLSRRAAARYARYVNLEVRLGDAEKQREMLEWAEARLA